MKSYVRPMPFAWWLSRRAYTLFVVRELTSVFIGGYALLLLLLVRSLAAGPDAYAAFLAALRSPGARLFHVIAFAAALYHTITWLRLAPMATPAQLRRPWISARTVISGGYALWALISAALAWWLLRT